jgi:TetR/AcrR family transcriptional repressor of mexCD-oprJ operon
MIRYRIAVAQGQKVRDHVSMAILDAAATVIAEHGENATMADVAESAGVGRATLYRYFANRDELLRALAEAAIDDASARIADAELEDVDVPEALARLTRALVSCGSKYSVIIDDIRHVDPEELESRIGEPVRSVMRRGVADGTLRRDLPIELLVGLWSGLLGAAIRSLTPLKLGVEPASAAVTSVFLSGAGIPRTLSEA